jgi:hypothetical protein
MRVFDIGDPANPKEIAYYKPPARRMEYRPASSMYFLTGGQNTYDHTADWSSANSRFVWHGSELHLWMTSQDNGFQVLRFTNGVGAETTLPKPSGGGCTTASGSLGLLAVVGLLPLLRRRRRRRAERTADTGAAGRGG